jgi:hypothetical protein
MKWAMCAVKGTQLQRVQVPPRQGRPGRVAIPAAAEVTPRGDAPGGGAQF